MTGCPTGKVPYLTRAEARHVARRMRGNIEPYVCVACAAWHLTSMARRRYRAAQKGRN